MSDATSTLSQTYTLPGDTPPVQVGAFERQLKRIWFTVNREEPSTANGNLYVFEGIGLRP